MYYEKDNCLVNISNSILKHFGIDTLHASHDKLDSILAKNRDKKICLCLFDGMGKYIEELHAEYIPHILEHNKFTITSVFPPTTVAATTSLLSALFPCETGWLGWTQRVATCPHPVIMFSSKDDVTQADVKPHTYETYKYVSIIDRLQQKNITAEEIKSFELKEKSMKGFFNVVNGKLHSNDFLYVYNTEPDTSLHQYGTKSKRISKIVHQIDTYMEKIAKENPHTLFIVLADHGHIDTKYFLLDEHDDLLDCLSEKMNFLEPRAAVFFVKPDRRKSFVEIFNKYYGKYFRLYSRADVERLKIFGEGKPNVDFESFIGDFLAVSHSEYAIVNSPDKMSMISHHAGGTDQEKYINVSFFNDD